MKTEYKNIRKMIISAALVLCLAVSVSARTITVFDFDHENEKEVGVGELTCDSYFSALAETHAISYGEEGDLVYVQLYFDGILASDGLAYNNQTNASATGKGNNPNNISGYHSVIRGDKSYLGSTNISASQLVDDN